MISLQFSHWLPRYCNFAEVISFVKSWKSEVSTGVVAPAVDAVGARFGRLSEMVGSWPPYVSAY